MNREKLLQSLLEFFQMLPDSEEKPEGDAKVEVLSMEGEKPEADEMAESEGLDALVDKKKLC
jgi:hypothetical protein